jgi:ABC-type glycerol-3-phosphate transport system permease component
MKLITWNIQWGLGMDERLDLRRIDWSVICAATLMTSGPLLLGFLLFQRQFVQSFMRAGIR